MDLIDAWVDGYLREQELYLDVAGMTRYLRFAGVKPEDSMQVFYESLAELEGFELDERQAMDAAILVTVSKLEEEGHGNLEQFLSYSIGKSKGLDPGHYPVFP